MTDKVRQFILEFAQKYSPFHDVLEVGSLDINGSVRNMFGCSYTGIDLQMGKGVEIVMDAMDIRKKFKQGNFDLCLCLETLEHAKDPVKIVNNMRWVLRSGGWMLITVPGIAHTEHGYPSDYYRFFINAFRDVFFKDFENCKFENKIWDCPGIKEPNTMYPCAIFGYGQKP